MQSDDISRRTLLTQAGLATSIAAVAGCLGDEETPELADDPSTPDSSGDYGSWPMQRFDAANRLSVPYSGVDGEPEVRWSKEYEFMYDTPVVYDDVVFTCSRHLENVLYEALDLENGEPIWDYETKSGTARAVSETALFVAGDGLEALDREDGAVRWQSDHGPEVTSIRLYDELIYAGIGSSLVVFDEDGDEQLDLETPEPVQSLAIDEDVVYARCREDEDVDDFVLVGYDRSGGEELWRYEFSHAEQWIDDRVTRTFPVVDGKVYQPTDDGFEEIDGATGNSEFIVEFDETEAAWTRPAIHDGVAYMEHGGLAYQIDDGEPVESWDPDGVYDFPIIMSSEHAYTTTGATELVALSPDSGEARWEIASESEASPFLPVILDGVALIPTHRGGGLTVIE